ncbi:MAG TPA: endonuclease/exonuclease/phosphatase family protein, partial [Candidatus Limnocylindria bacterium]|nr:endonuclease/exonuclease/phosphatase family protein [Candidatus Limnocylindria bacterium]
MKFFSLLVTLSLLGSHSVAGPAHSVPSVGKKKAKVKKQVKKKKQQKKKTSLSKKKLVKKALSKKKVVGKKVTQRVPHRATVLQDLPHSSIWPVLAQGASLNAGDKKTLFIQDCARLAVDNNIPAKFPPHETNNNTLRIMTYNVHKWLEPFERQDAYEKIMQVINNVQADVMCLQEVVQEPRSTWKDRLNDLGYLYQVYIPLEPARRGWLGNLVASKYPFMQQPERKVFVV